MKGDPNRTDQVNKGTFLFLKQKCISFLYEGRERKTFFLYPLTEECRKLNLLSFIHLPCAFLPPCVAAAAPQRNAVAHNALVMERMMKGLEGDVLKTRVTGVAFKKEA